MKSKRFLVSYAFLGENFQGVTKIPKGENSRTVQIIIETRLQDSFPEEKIKIRFASRLDKGVSALKSFCMLIFENAVEFETVNASLQNLGSDFLIINIFGLDQKSIMLNLVSNKKYTYFFSFGDQINNASLISSAQLPWTHFNDNFNIDIMRLCLKNMEGRHDFINFIAKKSKAEIARIYSTTKFIKNIELEFQEFPQKLWQMQNTKSPTKEPLKTWGLSFTGESFMRGQVRLMVGALFKVSSLQISIDRFDQLLSALVSDEPKWLVPAKGLVLIDTQLKD